MQHNKEEVKVILYDSPESAQLVHLDLPDGTSYGKGWVSINRRFYPTEQQARNDSATHKKCDGCQDVIPVRSYCKSCHSKKMQERYLSMPFQQYDGKSYLTTDDGDEFFRDEDEVREWCADHDDIKPEDLDLVICEPNRLFTIDSSIWADIMPEDGDGDLPKEVQEALDNLNAVIEKQGPISWGAGKYRTTISNE